MENIFFDIGLIIIIATIGALISRLIRQPTIPAYILAGVVIGPLLKLITDYAVISTLSEMGIAFLLFIVGLEIDFKKLGSVARVSVFGGIAQIIVLFNLGFLIAIYLGYLKIQAVYFGLILTFSSTAVVLKLLSDKNELDSLHARIVLGFLLIEDIVVVLALSVLTSLSEFSFVILLFALLKGGLIVIGSMFLSRYIFPSLFKYAAKNQELLFLVSISVLFVFAFVFHLLGFSIVIGSFVAGVVLGNLPYNLEIISRAESLKDFFATIFFVSLGLGLTISAINSILLPLVVLFFIVILVKPLVTMTIVSLFGYNKRPAFFASMSLTQISEFSLIIVAQGLILGHISRDLFTMTVVLMMATVTVTSYLIKYDHKIFKMIGSKISIFERFSKSASELENIPKKFKPDYILCGYNRIGYSIVKSLSKKKKKLLVVDYNPEVIRELLKKRSMRCIYGDISDLDLLGKLGLEHAKVVISTDPALNDNLLLIKKVQQKNRTAKIIVTSNQIYEALELYSAGADYVVLPHLLGGDHVSVMLENLDTDINHLVKARKGHIKELEHRLKSLYKVRKKL